MFKPQAFAMLHFDEKWDIGPTNLAPGKGARCWNFTTTFERGAAFQIPFYVFQRSRESWQTFAARLSRSGSKVTQRLSQ
jgi:hypothetical protein